LTKGNLSANLQKLEEAGYIQITKSFKDRYPNTACALSEQGRTAFQHYWESYQALGEALKLAAKPSSEE
jgi:DNA-binding MarR family transcriptional regulator